MYFWATSSLVERLALGDVSDREKMLYLAGGWLVYALLSYSTLVFSNSGRTWFGTIECFLLLTVIIIGFWRSFATVSAAGSGGSFVTDFTCLLLPITIRTYVLVWGGYWLLRWASRKVVLSTEFSDATIDAVDFFVQNSWWLATMIATVVAQVLLFWLMAKNLHAVAARRAGKSS